MRRFAVLVNPNYPAALRETDEVRAAAEKLDLELVRAEVRAPQDFAPAIEAAKAGADALYVCTDSFANSNRAVINASAFSARLPTIQGFRNAALEGGLMSYGANFPALFRRAAEKVNLILRGAKPGDLPVEQPSKFDLVINLKTAEALGLTIPPVLLAAADEVME
jgi:putative ABC transport system substrate-binding protein